MSSLPATRLRRRLGRGVLRQLGWAVGAPLAVFRFLRRQVPLVEVDPAGARRALPPEDDREREEGVGPVLHRLYTATIRTPRLTAARLMAVIAADPNVIAPAEVLRFEKTRGAPGRLDEGDELLIRMAGPWNAPVRVVRRWDVGFRLAARREHPQLGQLDFRARDEDGEIVVEIQTRERASGVAFHLLRRIGLIGRMQSYTWAEMLENAAQLAGGRHLDRIAIASWGEPTRRFRRRRLGYRPPHTTKEAR